MTNVELDQLYLLLKLSGQLRGAMTEYDQLDQKNKDWNYYGAERWRTLEELEEEAEFWSLGVNYDRVKDMTYEQWKYEYFLDYLFDLPDD